MIGHQAIGYHRHAKLWGMFLDQPQKVQVIAYVEENLRLARPAIVDVIILPLRKQVTAIWHGRPLKRPEGCLLAS